MSSPLLWFSEFAKFLKTALLPQQGSDPTTPGAGFWALYPKSGGIYAKSSAGTVVGPFSAASTPGGSTTQVQYNNAGAFGGDSGFVYTGGMVGIGTANPIGVLTVHVGTDQNIAMRSVSGVIDIYSANDANTVFEPIQFNGSILAFNNETSGNVGIGTGSPRQTLDVSGNIITAWADAYIGTWFQDGSSFRLGLNTVVASRITDIHAYSSDATGTITFSTGTVSSPIERVRVSNDGTVGIGTVSPGAKLEIDAAASGIGLIVKANATTPGNLQEWRNSSGTALSSISSAGVPTFAGLLSANTTVNVSSNVTLTNRAVHFVSTAAARTLTLPAPSTGLFLVVKDSTGSGLTNNITINPASGLIDGAASFTVDANYMSVTIASDGTNYFVI